MTAAPFPPAVLADAGAATLAWMRRDVAEEPAVTGRLVASALALAEAFCGRALIARGHEEVLPVSGRWRALDAAPVTAIEGVTALGADAAPAVLAMGTYAVDIDPDGTGWVRVIDAGGPQQVAVAYRAGLAAGWDDLPPGIAQGVAILAAHLFDGRGGDAVPPAAVAALWRPWRRLRLMGAGRPAEARP